jgi:hypothetical protein
MRGPSSSLRTGSRVLLAAPAPLVTGTSRRKSALCIVREPSGSEAAYLATTQARVEVGSASKRATHALNALKA